MILRAVAGVALALSALLLSARMGAATEYDMTIYVLPEARLTDAIGSDDAALKGAMLADTAYIAEMGLDERFTDGSWRPVVDQLIAGTPGRGDFANGFALELLLRQLTPVEDRFQIGMPFAALTPPSDLMRVAGKARIAEFLDRLDYGVRRDDIGVAAKIGPTEYPARVWMVPADQASAILGDLPQIREMGQMLRGYDPTSKSRKTLHMRELLAAAVRADAMRFVSPGDAPPTEDELAARIRGELADPYTYVDSMSFLAKELDVIGTALDHAQSNGEAAVFVYRSW